MKASCGQEVKENYQTIESDINKFERIRLESLVLLNEKLGLELNHIRNEMIDIKQQKYGLDEKRKAIQEEQKNIERREMLLVEREKDVEIARREIEENLQQLGELALRLNQENQKLEKKKLNFREKQGIVKVDSKTPTKSEFEENSRRENRNDVKHQSLILPRYGSSESNEESETPLEMMPDGVNWKKKLESIFFSI